MADIDGGGLSFVSDLDNDRLDAAVEETLRRIQGLSDGFVEAGDSLDATMARMADSFDAQRDVVDSLESKMASLNQEIANLQPGDAQDKLREQAEDAERQLREEKVALVALGAGLSALQRIQSMTGETSEQLHSKMEAVENECKAQEAAIAKCRSELSLYNSSLANNHAMDEKTRAHIQSKVNALQGEIRVRQDLMRELQANSKELQVCAKEIEKQEQTVQRAATSTMSLRQRMRELQMQMVEMEANGQRNTEAYREIRNEVASLCDAMGDARAQMNVLANDEAGFAGVMQGLSGLSGGFSAVAGAMGLFGTENQDIQNIILKTQSIMAITNGLMQVSQTLNKDSAFMLGTVGKLREWYNGILLAGAGAQATDTAATEADTAAQTTNATSTEANTAATVQNTAAQTANAAARGAVTGATEAQTTATTALTAAQAGQTAAARAGTAANIGLAGGFRMIGAAIKSIPGIGWLLAGITALIGLYSHFSAKASEAKKKQKEFNEALVEGCYKPIGAIEQLAGKWNELGNNFEAKKQFIEDNKKKFEELGVSIHGVTDAENILIANKDAFIAAQVAKAKAMILIQQGMEAQKEALKLQNERDQESQTRVKLTWSGLENVWKKKNEEMKKKQAESESLFAQAREVEAEGFKKLEDAGIQGAQTYADGMLGFIEQKIQEKQAKLKELTDNEEYKKSLAELAELQDQANKITGNTTNQFRVSGGKSGTSAGSTKDPFVEALEKRKSEYQRFLKWMNSGDAILVASAKQEFETILKEGATYIEYLKRQREQILAVDVANRTKEQTKRLRTLNDAIAEETKRTVLEAFNQELSEQMSNAQSIIEMLKVIEQKRKELEGGGNEIDGKNDILDDAEENLQKQIDAQTKLANQYKDFEQQRAVIAQKYDEERRVARERGDIAMMERIADAERDELSRLSNDILSQSKDWQTLFDGLGSASTTTIEQLIQDIESQKIQFSGDFNAADIAEITDKLEKSGQEIAKNNPFDVLNNAFAELRRQLSDNDILSNEDDPFLQELKSQEEAYKQYQKWIQSGDKDLARGAKEAFADLIAQGSTYLDYLKNKKDELQGKIDVGIDVGDSMQIIDALIRKIESGRNANDVMKDALNDVFSQFNQELSGQMDNAQSIIEMLKVIEQKRKELEGGGNEIDAEKLDALEKAEKDIQRQMGAQIKGLLENYGGFIAAKRRLEEDFNADMAILERARIHATSEEERKAIETAIANRKRKFANDNESSGDTDYDQLKKAYRGYEEEISAIQKDFAEKRRVAREHGDTAMLARLAAAEEQAVSEVQRKMLENADWSALFDNLDSLSTKTIKEMIAKFEAKKIQLGSELSPEDLKAITDKLNEARRMVEERNPFAALGSAFQRLRQQMKDQRLLDDNDPFIQDLHTIELQYKEYEKWLKSGGQPLPEGVNTGLDALLKQGTTYLQYLYNQKKKLEGDVKMGVDVGNSLEKVDAMIRKVESGKSANDMMKDALKDTFSSAAGSLSFLSGAFDAVVGGMDKMGIQMDEETQQILGDIGGIMEGAAQAAEGIASGNPLAVIQGTITALSSAFDLFNTRDRAAQRSIRKHQEEIDKLQEAYKQLEWQIDKALGGATYRAQQSAIKNLQTQRAHLAGMAADEQSKKKSDSDKVKEYQSQIADLDRQIQDMMDNIANDILQTDAKSFADTLSSSLVDAFASGESAAKAFEQCVNEVLKNAIVNQLKKRFLEQQLQSALDNLESSMGYWSGDDFIFDGLSDTEIAKFKAKVQAAANNFNQALGIYEDLLKDLNINDDSDTSLTGAVKGVSEETASLVAGQMNAVRVNQYDMINIMRQQLMAMNQIVANTSYNRYLTKLDRIITLMERGNSIDSDLRSQGLIA